MRPAAGGSGLHRSSDSPQAIDGDVPRQQGRSATALRQLDAALAACQQAVRLKRNCAEAYQVMGNILSDLGRVEEAVAACRAAVRYKPDLQDAYNNLGLALRQAGQLEEALVALRQAVKRQPTDVVAQGNLASVLKELARLDEAEACYRAALRGQPNDPVLHLNLGVVLLLAGKFEPGWQEYEWRFQAGAARIPTCTQPRWNGEALAGRTLLIRAEQGLGDTIQFCRYVADGSTARRGGAGGAAGAATSAQRRARREADRHCGRGAATIRCLVSTAQPAALTGHGHAVAALPRRRCRSGGCVASAYRDAWPTNRHRLARQPDCRSGARTIISRYASFCPWRRCRCAADQFAKAPRS